MKKLIVWVIAALMISFWACEKPQEAQNANDTHLADTLAVDGGEISEDIMNLLVSIPNPREGANLLKEAGATFEQNLLNPENKVNNYRTQSEQAIGLGVYTADLSYASAFGKNESSLKYLSAIRNLADQLAIGNVFDKRLELRLKENSDNKDSLDRVFDDTFDQLSEQLKKAKQLPVQALLFSGAWVETAYLATQHWKQSPKPAIKKQVLERQSTLDDLIKILETYKSNEGAARILPAFIDIQKEFIPKGENKEFTDAQAEVVYEKIKKLRTQLIK